ncbi:MAG: acyltransferase [Acidimicrobiia bacterium]|nr:acyltransferase [Acidimicrobiia bacterium]
MTSISGPADVGAGERFVAQDLPVSPVDSGVRQEGSAGEGRTRSTSVNELVDATPEHRDRSVDFLRAVSIAVVVLWHWVFSITHWTDEGAGRHLTMPNPVGDVRLLWLATWALQVMPLFFLVGGYANLASLDAHRRNGGRDRAWMRSRLERLGRPALALAAVWAVADVLVRIAAPGYPGVLRWGMVVFVPLWFLGVYAAVVVLAPVTADLHRRLGSLAVVLLGAAIALSDLGRFRFGWSELGILNAALVFVFAHQLGYWWRDGSLTRRRAASVAVAGLTALVVLTNLGVYPRSMVAVRGEAVSNMFPTTACIAALACFQLGLVVLLRPALERWLRRSRTAWKLTVAANGVAMTVFCWHMTALVAVIGAAGLLGIEPGDDATAAWWAARPLLIVLPGVVLAALVAVFHRLERPRRPAPDPVRVSAGR